MRHALSVPLREDHLVIKNVSIQNFRGYKSLKLSNLKRINVVVGENGSGKTALLEALYLGLGAHPELYLRLRAQRGLGDRIPVPFTKAAGGDLFNDANKPVVISTVGTPGITRRTSIFYDEKVPITIPLDQQGASSAPPLAFQWKDHGERPKTMHLWIKEGNIEIAGGPKDPKSVSFFSGALLQNPVEVAERFHRLDERDNAGPLVQAMREVFPVVDDLSIGTYAGMPMMYARLKGQKGKRQLGLISSGINKLLSILAAIFDHAGRAVLIDEIENGLYYDVMQKTWASMFQFSKENRTQLFVSTHSLECLKALLPVIRNHEDQFCLLRIRYKDGNSVVRQIEGSSFEAALEQGMEVR